MFINSFFLNSLSKMSELENRILGIVELRASGLDDKKIAKKLGLDGTVVKMYEESAKKIINDAISKGYRTSEDIGGFVKLSPIVVDMCIRIYGVGIPAEEKISIPQRPYSRPRQKSLDAIKKAIANGAKSVDEVAEKTGLSKNTVKVYSSQEKIKLPKQPKPYSGEAISKGRTISRNRKLQIIRDSLNGGVNSLEELCKRTGIRTAEGVKIYCARFGIELPEDIIAYRQRPEIDALIEKGLSLPAIGKEVGLSRERVRQYINFSGQYKQWIKGREEVKKCPKIEERKFKESQGIFLSIVRARTEELARKEGFAVKKAVEYLHSRKVKFPQSYDFSLLQTIYQRYWDAFKEGKKLSSEEIGAGLEIFPSTVWRILKAVGVEPMRGNKIRTIKSGEKNDAVQRGFATDFSVFDIAYFLGLPRAVPGNRFSYKNIKRKKNKPLAIFCSGDSREYLHHSLASEIYEAQDCGFKRREVLELVDKSKKLVGYALEHRNKIEPKIIEGLKVLYGDANINTSYVTSEMREKLEQEDRKR